MSDCNIRRDNVETGDNVEWRKMTMTLVVNNNGDDADGE